jgi:hypothetical protein
MNASERRYSEVELALMADRLDRAIELSALCMDLALAGRLQRISSRKRTGLPRPAPDESTSSNAVDAALASQ